MDQHQANLAYVEMLLRQQQAAAMGLKPEFMHSADDLRAQAQAQAAMNSARKAPPRSRFDGPNVIDLIPAADGSYHVPPVLEYRVRQPF